MTEGVYNLSSVSRKMQDLIIKNVKTAEYKTVDSQPVSYRGERDGN